MKSNCSWQVRTAQVLLGAALFIALVVVHGTNAQNDPVHLTTDWSHRHVIFSTPTTLGEQLKASSEPRYVQQWVRRNAAKKFDAQASRWQRAAAEAEEDESAESGPNVASAAVRRQRPRPNPLKKDWSMNMGTGATLSAGVFPAKWAFDPTIANCGNAVLPAKPDYVVYNTSLLGNNTGVAATAQGTFLGLAAVGSTITIMNPALGTTLVMTPGAVNGHTGAANSGMGTYVTGTNAVEASNLRLAINVANNGSFVGVTAAYPGGAIVNFTASSTGIAGNNIVVSSSGTSNFTWGAGVTNFSGGASGQASIMAFDNLYVGGCTGVTPSPYWAYNTGGLADTSPIVSYDGKQVAFIQNTGGVASLVIVKWLANAADNFNNPNPALAVVANAAYRACVAPCMTTIPFANPNLTTRTDNSSSPFYDYFTDIIYVADDGGNLHQFSAVFLGTPSERIVAGQWPVLLTKNVIATSPVLDDSTGQVFVGDRGGFLYSVTTAGAPVVTKSGRVGFSLGIVDSPMLDPVVGKVYVTVSNDAVTLPVTGNHSRVIQFPAAFLTGSTGASFAQVGDSSGIVTGFSGAFDDAYLLSPTGTAGNIYVCGSQPGASYIPTLWQIPITGAGALGVPNQGPALASVVGGACSPVTEIFNPNAAGGAKDWVYLSVTNHAVPAGVINCGISGGGCIMSFDVTSGAAITAATPTVGHTAVTGGASGVGADNTVAAGTLAGASQVYFTPLGNQVCTTSGGNGGCAIQASQSGLN